MSAAAGDRRTIVIAGGGIGGLTTALALSSVGYRPIIVERAAEASNVGAGIQLAPNAGKVLADLGLDDAIAQRSIEPDVIEIHGAGGRVVASIPGSAFRLRYGFPYRVIHRADLHAILVAAVRADPDIRFKPGAAIAAMQPKSDGIDVRIETGVAENVNAVALIAADGVRSSFRGKVPGSAMAVPSGRTAWRAMVETAALSGLGSRRSVGVWLGRDAHVVHYPVASGEVTNIVAIVEEPWTGADWSAPGDGLTLQGRFAHWPAAVRTLLATATSWQKFAIATVDPDGRWTDGRVALLGDAAHAMLPFLAQGAAMAIEDAVFLAATLDDAVNIPGALATFEAARRPRVSRVAAASQQTGGRYHFGPAMAFARDTALRIAGRRLVLNGNDWLYGWRPPSRDPRLMTPILRSSQ